MRYKLKNSEGFRTKICEIATATVIGAGDLVAIDGSTGLIIKAVTASTKIGYAPNAHAANSGTEIEVSVGNQFTLEGPGESAFDEPYRGLDYDINNDGSQTIDYNGTTYKVLTVVDGVVGTATGVEVRINKPLF